MTVYFLGLNFDHIYGQTAIPDYGHAFLAKPQAHSRHCSQNNLAVSLLKSCRPRGCPNICLLLLLCITDNTSNPLYTLTNHK